MKGRVNIDKLTSFLEDLRLSKNRTVSLGALMCASDASAADSKHLAEVRHVLSTAGHRLVCLNIGRVCQELHKVIQHLAQHLFILSIASVDLLVLQHTALLLHVLAATNMLLLNTRHARCMLQLTADTVAELAVQNLLAVTGTHCRMAQQSQGISSSLFISALI